MSWFCLFTCGDLSQQHMNINALDGFDFLGGGLLILNDPPDDLYSYFRADCSEKIDLFDAHNACIHSFISRSTFVSLYICELSLLSILTLTPIVRVIKKIQKMRPYELSPRLTPKNVEAFLFRGKTSSRGSAATEAFSISWRL
jgi:hypothetical protein